MSNAYQDDINANIQEKIREEFVNSIRPLEILPHIRSYDRNALEPTDVGYIQAVTKVKGDRAGAQELLDRLVKYQQWFPCLLQVLRDPQVGLHQVAQRMEKAAQNEDPQEYIRKKIRRTFVNYIDPDNVLYLFHTFNINVLTQRDIDRVRAVTQNRGRGDGAEELLSILPRYEGWYECLLKVLRHPDVKLGHVAALMEELLNEPPSDNATEGSRNQAGQSAELKQTERTEHNRAPSLADETTLMKVGTSAPSVDTSHMNQTSPEVQPTLGEPVSGASAGPDSVDALPSDLQVINPKDIRRNKLVGSGSYGHVFRASWHGKMTVAVKGFDREGKSFERELTKLAAIRHPNIVILFGVYFNNSTDKDDDESQAFPAYPANIVMEFADEGSLQHVIHKSNDPYTREDVIRWCRQCAEGVAYLHSLTPKVLHRDLKPANLLLFERRSILKICDFGTARDIKTTMTKYKGTAIYMAPEIARGMKYNEKCDIFSFGVVCWEALKRRQPTAEKKDGIPTAMTSKMGKGSIENIPQEMESLMESCWLLDASKRPSMKDIVSVMSAAHEFFTEAALQENVLKPSSTTHTNSSDED